MSRLRTWSLVVLTASVLGLAGCSSSSANSSASSTTTPHSTATTSAPVAAVAVQDPSPAGTFGTQPTVTVPSGPPPTQLESTDLIVGTGPAAKPGDMVTVQYVLATYSSDKVIQSSWTSQSFSFTLDANPEQVIPGWDRAWWACRSAVGASWSSHPPSATATSRRARGSPPMTPWCSWSTC
jgi:peptidylprolyl isomerase